MYALDLKTRKILWKFQTGLPPGSPKGFLKDFTDIITAETEKKPFTLSAWKPETLKKSYDWKSEVGNIVTSPYKSENPYMNKPVYRMNNPYKEKEDSDFPWKRKKS